MDTDCLVLVNASAGGGTEHAAHELLGARLRRHGLRPEVVELDKQSAPAQLARDAVAHGVPLVVAGGGDGTVGQVAGALVDSDATLGVLPFGTLNHFAKDLGIPLDEDEAVATLAEGRTGRVDAARVNDRVFLNNSSIGLYPEIVRHREAQQQRLGRGKWLSFVWACVAALRRYPFLQVEVEVDGQVLRRRSAFVFVGNNAYQMEGLDIGERKRLDAGTLCLWVSRDVGRLGLFGLAVRALFGRLAQARDLEMLEAHAFTIGTGHARLDVSADGEVCTMDAPLRYESLPGALRVRVPQDCTAIAAGADAGVRTAADARADNVVPLHPRSVAGLP
jgi:diacylglycerol kinase family enzyme